jgi:hypothetical protein
MDDRIHGKDCTGLIVDELALINHARGAVAPHRLNFPDELTFFVDDDVTREPSAFWDSPACGHFSGRAVVPGVFIVFEDDLHRIRREMQADMIRGLNDLTRDLARRAVQDLFATMVPRDVPYPVAARWFDDFRTKPTSRPRKINIAIPAPRMPRRGQSLSVLRRDKRRRQLHALRAV